MKMLRALVVAIVAVATLAACGTPAGSGPGSGSGADRLRVVTGAYPLEYAIERIGGDHVSVENLTPPGAEPHDLELSPRQVGDLASADLVVYLSGLQPSLDDAAQTQVSPQALLDVADAARLVAQDEHDHAAESGSHPAEEHGHGSQDPHFWLDPTRLADVGDAVAQKLSAQDSAHAADYRRNAESLRADLQALDKEFATGLATCTSRDLVTSHEAFGYLAGRYDLHQIGIAGLTPEDEPSPRALADLVAHVRSTGTTTIYTETLVAPDVAETVAREAGVRTAVLDPIEGLTGDAPDSDYLTVMRTNLQTLRTGQGCA